METKPKSKRRKIICWDDYVAYPVGDNIGEAITFSRNAAAKFTTIKKFKGKAINVWCRGSSGAILAALFSAELVGHAIRICHVKKEGELSHNGSVKPRYLAVNVIIDDFCETGSTLNAIYSELIDNNSQGKVDCLIIGTTRGTKQEGRLEKLLKFKPPIIITNSLKNN